MRRTLEFGLHFVHTCDQVSERAIAKGRNTEKETRTRIASDANGPEVAILVGLADAEEASDIRESGVNVL